ncbi:retropepsin-like aspartic protease family protein [Sphingomonas sp. Tas61C01]|uniref:retropepsin-like aspartic protease family protein n=1 Tax=Sphingomonas sp. Tas61C01 TaxID=3458297 RepID=UPI00403E7575
MSADRSADALLFVLLLILPLSALIARRVPLKRTGAMALAWAAIFAVGLLIASQRHRFVGITSLFSDQQVEGAETRIAMAEDGHFWAEVTINGVRRRMLIDSGATTTALSAATAAAAKLDMEQSPFPAILNTANGSIAARTATVAVLTVGNVTARDFGVVVSPAFGDTDVLGMNFLSRLQSWRVEGQTLVLVPNGT